MNQPCWMRGYAILISLLAGLHLCAQGEIGVVAGISNFQGDLSSFSTSNGLRVLIGPVFGLHAGLEKTPHFQYRADIQYLRLSGDDALAASVLTQQRNLHFFSPVIQLAVGVDWNILGFSQDQQQDFSPYLSLGASAFYFSPRAHYEGQVVALRPLGTEGQYLDDYPDQNPYSPVQPSIQTGGGLKFLFNKKWIVALEAMMSTTFTDYLDDVSRIYISYPELLEKAGPLTAALANRQGEFLGTEPVVLPTGTPRANQKSKDFFGVITARVCVPFEVRTGPFKIRRHNKGKKLDCPRF